MNGDDAEVARLTRLLAEAQEQQRELVRHVRNVLAVIRALIRQAMPASHDPEEYRARLEGRVDAFARAQAMLLGDLRRGSDLDSLIRDQLVLFGVRTDDEVRIDGPAVRLDARATGIMALLIHELALGTVEDSGHPQSVTWRIGEDGVALELEWVDEGQGEREFDLMERALRYELGGSLTTKLDGGSRSCTVRLPSDHVLPAP